MNWTPEAIEAYAQSTVYMLLNNGRTDPLLEARVKDVTPIEDRDMVIALPPEVRARWMEILREVKPALADKYEREHRATERGRKVSYRTVSLLGVEEAFKNHPAVVQSFQHAAYAIDPEHKDAPAIEGIVDRGIALLRQREDLVSELRALVTG